MKVSIYHANVPNFGYPTNQRPDPVWPTGFTKVAEVTLPSLTPGVGKVVTEMTNMAALEFAFERTNTINRPWWENEGVVRVDIEQPKTYPCRGLRSTSVGDMAMIGSKRFLCDHAGWKQVE